MSTSEREQEPTAPGDVELSPPEPRKRFRPHERVRDTRDFQRAFSLRRAVSDAHLIVHAALNGLPYTRLGISVPRKVVRRAARRNRIKRRIREGFRLTKAGLPRGLDLIVVPRDLKIGMAQVRQSLPKLAADAARRLGHVSGPSVPPGAG